MPLRGQSYTMLPFSHDGNAFVSNALLLAQGCSLFFFSKRMLHWRWQCSIVSEWRYPTRVGYLNLCCCKNRALMFPQIPQICRGTHPSSTSLLFPSIRLCSDTSRPRCPARTTWVSSHCLEVSLTAMRQNRMKHHVGNVIYERLNFFQNYSARSSRSVLNFT